jgi:hypothetical protein
LGGRGGAVRHPVVVAGTASTFANLCAGNARGNEEMFLADVGRIERLNGVVFISIAFLGVFTVAWIFYSPFWCARSLNTL